MKKTQSTPQFAAEGAVSYLEICHGVGGGGDAVLETTASAASATDIVDATEFSSPPAPGHRKLVEAKDLMLDSAVTTPTRLGTSAPDSVCTTFSAFSNRPGTTGSLALATSPSKTISR